MDLKHFEIQTLNTDDSCNESQENNKKGKNCPSIEVVMFVTLERFNRDDNDMSLLDPPSFISVFIPFQIRHCFHSFCFFYEIEWDCVWEKFLSRIWSSMTMWETIFGSTQCLLLFSVLISVDIVVAFLLQWMTSTESRMMTKCVFFTTYWTHTDVNLFVIINAKYIEERNRGKCRRSVSLTDNELRWWLTGNHKYREKDRNQRLSCNLNCIANHEFPTSCSHHTFLLRSRQNLHHISFTLKCYYYRYTRFQLPKIFNTVDVKHSRHGSDMFVIVDAVFQSDLLPSDSLSLI
jgi:hypothetical protein